jgi:hypothetical protein
VGGAVAFPNEISTGVEPTQPVWKSEYLFAIFVRQSRIKFELPQ